MQYHETLHCLFPHLYCIALHDSSIASLTLSPSFSDHESAVNKEILSWGRDQLKAISSPDGSHSTASGTGEGGVKGEGALKLHKAILDVL